MSYTVILSDNVWSDIQKLKKSGEKSTLKKLDKLLDELEKHPRTGTGKPEQKKYNLKGCWSRNITDKHRLLYVIKDEEVVVLVISAYGHYDDK